jgi:hypothetical protein
MTSFHRDLAEILRTKYTLAMCKQVQCRNEHSAGGRLRLRIHGGLCGGVKNATNRVYIFLKATLR